ncbi:MAG TPA: tetratricopeptide repeat protein [Verrucomicrobiae bacterium]
MTEPGSQRQRWIVCILLALVTMALFLPATRYGFIRYDDQDYVTENKDVQQGLNLHSIGWALTTDHASNWHPVTWLSHMVDCQLYGLQPAGHHLTNLLIHTANAVLLLLLLWRLTGALWPSAFVAAMFALHPLHVESVAWIAERKDVLSTFFWMLTALAYVGYAERVKAEKPNRQIFYILALVFFALGLMAKPMLVTLPFVLLLLDYWPLGRLEFGPAFRWRLVMEKIPFLMLAAAESVVTFLIQRRFGAVQSLGSYPLLSRLANVPVAYVRYIEKNFWPVNLAVHYPHRPLGTMEVLGAIVVLAGVSIVVVQRLKAQPYLAVGWCWFLGMLVPTIGLVQVGNQAMADRYSYLSTVGLWIMVTWAVRDCVDSGKLPRPLAALAEGLTILACIVLTSMQLPYWRNTHTLFAHADEATGGSYVACYNLGCDAMAEKNYPEAIDFFTKALTAEPDSAGWADHAPDYNNMGYVYLQVGDITKAVANFEKALKLRPNYGEAYYNLGCAFLDNKQPAEAIDCLQRALAIDLSVAAIHYKLANALAQTNQYAKAILEYRQALKLRPDWDEPANNLAWLLATCPDRALRNGAEAVTIAKQASERSQNRSPIILGTLAAAYAESGKRAEAVPIAEQARRIALEQNNKALAEMLEAQLRQYQNKTGASNP